MIVLVMMGRLLEVSQGRKVFEAQMMLAGATCLMSFSDIYFSVMTAMNQYTVGIAIGLPVRHRIFAIRFKRMAICEPDTRDIVKDVATKNKSTI